MALPAQNPASIGTGKDYSTVAAWEVDLESANLDADYVGEIYGLTEDNATIYFSGGNSTASYKAILRAASGEEADGTNAKGAQIDSILPIDETTNQWNMDIETIEFHTAGRILYRADHADNVTNVLKSVFRDIGESGITITGCGAAEINIGICLFRNIFNSWKTGVLLADADPTVKVINCTAYDMDYGCVDETTGTFAAVKNCVSVCDEVDAGYDDYHGTPNNMSYCADSGDNTATGTGSIHTAARADEWVNYATDDFKVKNTSAHIYHAGNVISGESWFPATDMAGTAWNNPPSMGCYEYLTTGAYTIVASSGSYILTGTAVNLLRDGKIVALTDSYALTGVATNLEKGYKLSAGVGLYTLTGVSADLLRALKLDVVAGSFALTGSSLNLLLGRKLVLDSGIYVLTGNSVGLNYSGGPAFTVRCYTLGEDPGIELIC